MNVHYTSTVQWHVFSEVLYLECMCNIQHCMLSAEMPKIPSSSVRNNIELDFNHLVLNLS